MNEKMRISLACNWKHNLLSFLEENPELKNNVHDLYGTYDFSFTGSGRPFLLMQKKGKSEIEDYINRVHELGLSFTWLWNGECLGYFKFDKEQQSNALKELDWLDDMGVEYLTVADPYLAQFAKTYHPNLRLKVSVISEINSLTRALEWEEIIGSKGVLTLSIMLNRNFPMLTKIRDVVECDIELLLNDCCLNECPFRFFHYTECSHASQKHDVLEGYYNDWATIACQNQKAYNPEQILMSKWIQPSDLDGYMDIGIDYFKISGRRYATAWLIQALKAYSKKEYKGSLGDILNGYSFVSDPLELAGGQFSEFSAKQEKMGGNPEDQGIMLSVPDFNSKLFTEKLDAFIEKMPFQGAQCAENCGVTCNYCFEVAKSAYKTPDEDRAQSYQEYMRFLYRYLNKGEMFKPEGERELKKPGTKSKSKTYTGISWDKEAKTFFKEAMVLVPDSMKKAAKQGIGYTAERTAERQGLTSVNKQLLIAIINKLIPQPFKHDFYDFLVEKQIDPLEYINEEEANQIKSLPYGTDLMREKAQEKGFSVQKHTIKQKLEKVKQKEVKMKLNTKEEWEEYLERFMDAYNELPDVKDLLEPVAPLIFQYKITDKPEMNYWQFIEEDKMKWGMGEYDGPDAPKIIHKTDFETMKQVNSGETDPIKATMSGTYEVEGDSEKLMACAPLLPLNAKAHEKAVSK
jgi:collagenase-like PrtC family protease/putative sterol carrier protein